MYCITDGGGGGGGSTCLPDIVLVFQQKEKQKQKKNLNENFNCKSSSFIKVSTFYRFILSIFIFPCIHATHLLVKLQFIMLQLLLNTKK